MTERIIDYQAAPPCSYARKDSLLTRPLQSHAMPNRENAALNSTPMLVSPYLSLIRRLHPRLLLLTLQHTL